MRRIILILFILNASLLSAQNCIPSALVLVNQADVDNFPTNYPGCTIIDGSLGVSGSVTNLDSLIQLVEVKGNVLIDNSTTLNDISGLNNITRIGGFMKFGTLASLINFNGFSNLMVIEGNFELNLPYYPDLDNLSNLDSIYGSFTIINPTNNFLDIEGLNQITFIGGDFYLSGRIVFNQFFNTLPTLMGNVSLLMSNIEDLVFENLVTVQGNLKIDGGLTSVDFPSLTDIYGKLEIISNNQLIKADFPALRNITNLLDINFNGQLTTIDNFPVLEEVGTDITIKNNNNLETINTFDSVQIVNNVVVQFNNKLDTLYGFNALSECNAISLYKVKLGALNAFNNLINVHSIFTRECSEMINFQFDSLQSSSGSLTMLLNPKLTNVSLANLVSMGIMQIQGNPALQYFDSGNNVGSAAYIEFKSNSVLTSVTGFQQVLSSSQLIFDNNPFLADISGFDHPVDINNLKIINNPFLSLCSVQAICDHLSQSSYVATISNNAPNCDSETEVLSNCPNPPDTDGDGIPDYEDNCDMVSNPGQEDSDNNGIGDACEPFVDSDGDGIANSDDNCPTGFNPDQADSNNNGMGDVCDTSDTDEDGITDNLDNCPNVYNPGQEDSNGNNIGDACDMSDTDGDGIADNVDNCPNAHNPNQEDSDNNGVGDICEPPLDTDGDGVPNFSDNCIDIFNPDQTDNNNNGMGDACEVFYKIGIGTDNPAAELHVSNGNIYLDNPSKGIIFKHSDGNCYLVKINKIDTSPKLGISQIDCPE